MEPILTQEMTTDLIEGLLQIFKDDISQIILYGSIARNEAAADSDIDIAIILTAELDAQKRDMFISWASDMDLKYERVFSIVDIQKKRYDEWRDDLPFYGNIRNDGIILWSAKQSKTTASEILKSRGIL